MRTSSFIASLGSVALVVLLAGCKHAPTEKERAGSDIHYDLGVQALNNGNMQEAFAEFEQSLRLNEQNAFAHQALAQVLHLAFGRPQEAIRHYERALELDPQLTEAKVNLGNVYLDLKRFDEAAKLYEEALGDMRYRTPFIAQGNLGMAEYRRGNVEKAVDHLRSAITLNPQFCLGYRNLGTIFEDTGKTEQACTEFSRYRESCPDAVDAYFREGVCLAKLGKVEEARNRLAECAEKAPVGQMKDDCRRLGEQLN